jgi:hypothetical protein
MLFTLLTSSRLYLFVSTNNSDKVILRSLSVEGVVGGGAPSCTACDFGDVSPDGSDRCLPCQVGTQSNVQRTSCERCPSGTFSEQAGGQCLPCGNGTWSAAGASKCSSNCSFTMGNGRTFDLSPLSRPDFFPAVLDKNMRYYLNPCAYGYNSSLCYDDQRRPLNTTACQYTGAGYIDIGHVINVLNYTDRS